MSPEKISLPKIGLGTYSLRGAAGVAVIREAIDAGYRLLDTAFNYDNEGAVGKAIRVDRGLQIARPAP